MAKQIIFFSLLVFFAGGCVHRGDQTLPPPKPPEVSYVVEKIVVFPFGYEKGIPQEVRDRVYRSFIKYLIRKRKVYVVHPDVVRQALGKLDYVIDKESAEKISGRLGVDGFIIGYLSDFSREPLSLSLDVQLYPLVNSDIRLCEAHRNYNSEDAITVAHMKKYTRLFSWKRRPLGWRRVQVKLNLFLDFVAWDIVQSFF